MGNVEAPVLEAQTPSTRYKVLQRAWSTCSRMARKIATSVIFDYPRQYTRSYVLLQIPVRASRSVLRISGKGVFKRFQK